MLEMHHRKPGLMYSAYAPFTKNKTGIQKYEKKTGDLRYIYLIELDKARFQREEQPLTKYCMIKHLQLPVVHGIMDTNDDLPQWFL